MIRIFKLIILLVISQVAFGQAPSNYTNINGRYRWIAGMFDSTFHIPKGATPSLRTGGSTNAGGLFYNTADSSVYTYTGTQWIKARGSINPQDTTNKYITQVYKKNGSDSVFYVKGGVHTWAFNDSTGSPGGGGGGKIYYFNGGVSMGTFGGFTMYELGDTANTGTAANFTRSTTGNIANFITDPGKPGLLQIPAGVWSVDAWLSETGGGANHAEIWIEVEKWDGSNITTIAISPIEQITEGSTPNLYSWSVSIPTTSLTVTDRIIIQFYISNTNGKTVTLYTQNGYVGEVHTTFTTGIGAINGLTAPAQYLVTGTSGTDFNINSATATHTFNLPTASATNRGALSSTDWTTFNNKGSVSSVATNTATGITGGTITTTGTLAIDTLLISTRAWRQKGIDSIRANYVPYTGATTNVDINTRLLSANSFKVNGNGVSSGGYLGFQQFNGTTSALSGYTILTALGQDKLFLSYAQSPTGTRTAILSSSLITTDSSYTYNFPNKGGTFAMTSDVTGAVSGTTNYIPKFTSSSAIGNSAIYNSGANVSINTTTPATNYPLTIRSTSGDYTKILDWGTDIGGSWGNLTINLSSPYQTILTSGAWQFNIGASEQMRLTSTGLGIGTSSPAYKLDVNGNAHIGTGDSRLIIGDVASANTESVIWLRTGSGKYAYSIAAQSLADESLTIARSTTQGGTTFTTASLTLNSSGNLGLGVTPSAWNSAYKAIQFGTTGAIFGESGDAANYFTTNTFIDGVGFKYITSDFATGYFQENGVHSWKYAASGTAGNAISFTQAMTLDASGNLMVGTTANNGAKVVFRGANSTPATSGTTTGAVLRLSSGTGLYNVLDFGTNEALDYSWIQSTRANSLGTYDKLLLNPNGGNVGINTTSPTYPLTVVSNSSTQGFRLAGRSSDNIANMSFTSNDQATEYAFFNTGATYFALGTNGSERMRITSTGNVGIGTTSPTSKLQINSTSAGAATVAAFLNNESNTLSTEVRLAFAANANNDIATNRYSYISALNTSGSNGQALLFATNETGNSAVERMRITSAGYLLLGTTTSLYGQAGRGTFEMNGSAENIFAQKIGGTLANYLYSDATKTELYSANFLQVSVNGSERMRITSGGELLINTTSDAGDYKLQVNGDLYTNSSYKGTGANFDPTSGNNWTKAAFSTITSASPYGGGLSLIDGTAGFTFYTINNGTLLRIGSATTSTNPTTQFTLDNSGNGVFTGSIKTAAPASGTAKPWKLGEAGVSVGGANTTAVKVEIDGVVYYLLTAYLPEPAPESAPKPKPEG